MKERECRGSASPAAIAYALDLAIDAAARHVGGRWRMSVECTEAGGDLLLDYRGEVPASALVVNGVQDAVVREHDLLRIPARLLRPGGNEFEMPVEASIAPSGTPVLRHDDPEDGAAYVHTLFVPADASALFPCIDRPDAKARFRLALGLPDGWTAVSCMPATSAEGRRMTFAQTPPLPTYAFAFAAGPLVAVPAVGTTAHGRAYVRRAAAARLHDDAVEALRLEQLARTWGERFFGMPFPFPKHDLVLIPGFAFGGMEHAGATFLDEAAIAPGGQPRDAARRRRAQLVFHETLHQWLGDCVTMTSFTDLWLKEGFANLGAALGAQACAPELDGLLWLQRLKATALRQDVSAGALAVRRHVAHAAEAKALYGPGVYGKAPAVLRQARRLLGEPAFDAGVRAFVAAHAWGNATCDDLADALEQTSGRPMREWLCGWLDVPGAPTIRMEIDTHVGHITAARVVRTGAAPVQRLEALAVAPDGDVRSTTYVLDAERVTLAAWAGAPAPLLAYPDAGGYGYARVLLDPATREAALVDLDRVGDALLRLQLAEALWEHVRDGDLDPARHLAFVLARLDAERDDTVAAVLLEHGDVAARRYVDDDRRDAALPALQRARSALGLASPAPADPRCAALRAQAEHLDPAIRARSFDALLGDASLPERCIELAAERFNAVADPAGTLPFIVPALAALPRIAATRRIFFVDRWLDAFIGGQREPEALAAVEAFLRRSTLDAALAAKVRAHADELARTLRIRDRPRRAS